MDLEQQLVAFGLTEYEARVYLALLREHPTTGYQISKVSGVPRSMVYEALGRLETRRAVLKTSEEKATLYRPVPPDVLLDRYADETEARIAALRSGLIPLYQRQDEERLWTFTGRREALRYAVELIQAAKYELMLVLSDADIVELAPALTEANGRGVTLGCMLTGQADFAVGQVVRHPNHETEIHGMRETLLIVADEHELLIASGHTETSGTMTTNTNMVLIARQFVWMELFAQRIFARLGDDLLKRLDPADRAVLY